MSMIYKTNIRFDKKVENAIEKFVRSSYRELSDAGFYSFWFEIKVKDKTICIYMYYDLDPEDSDKILSWHIHLQKKLLEDMKNVDLKKYDDVVFIIESYDLWSDSDGKAIKGK